VKHILQASVFLKLRNTVIYFAMNARMNKPTYETRTSEDGILFLQWRQWLMQDLYSSAQCRTLPDVR
jgi:hypothetical protein